METYTLCMRACQSIQLYSTLCNSMDCSPPGASVHGILQARIQEWVAMPSPRGSSRPNLREKEIATHSSALAWKIPWIEKPGKLQCIGSQRVRHD